VDDRVFEDGLRAWAAPRARIDPELLQVALHLDGLATPEESAAAQAILARDAELAEAFAIASAPRTFRIHKLISPLVAAAALITAVGLWLPERRGDELVPKGAADHLALAVERRGERFELAGGGALKEGDRFGLFYSASQPGHLTVLHRSAHRTEVLHAGSITAGTGLALPKGGVVSEVIGCEQLIALFSDAPLEVDPLVKQLSSSPDPCRAPEKISGARTIEAIALER
jgi:hypothetical protein